MPRKIVGGTKVPGNEKSWKRKFLGTKGPGNESSKNFHSPGMKVPENERARERKFPGRNEKSPERKFPRSTIRSWERKVLGTRSPGTASSLFNLRASQCFCTTSLHVLSICTNGRPKISNPCLIYYIFVIECTSLL